MSSPERKQDDSTTAGLNRNLELDDFEQPATTAGVMQEESLSSRPTGKPKIATIQCKTFAFEIFTAVRCLFKRVNCYNFRARNRSERIN